MWRHSLKNWELVNKDVYKFCFEQAEKRLKDVLDDGEKITNRAYTLIGILIPVLSVFVGVLLKNFSSKTVFDFVSILSLLGIVVLGICLFLLSRLIKVREVWFSGTEPQDIILSHYLEIDSLTEDESLKYMYLSEIESIQHKIDQNKLANEQRIRIFSNCLTVVIITTIVALSSLLSLTLLQ
jgi:hypothetical protein